MTEHPYSEENEEGPTGVDARDEAVEVPDYPAIAIFGHYDLLGRLGVGGMAEIFLARDRIGSTKVKHLVVKCLPEELAEESQAVMMFLDEARLANRLYHPNVCHVYESGEIAGTYYMAMEWVHGASLRRIIRRASERGAPPVGVAVRIAIHVARALNYVHNARGEGGRPLNIVHRDVSPQNVMVSWSGRVKLLDFGIAKNAEQFARTRAGVVKGKYAYMAPEQCKAQPVDARTDVFALGVTLYELISQQPLFHRDNVLATMKAVTTDEAPMLHEVVPGIPIELSAIVARALAKEPEDRWQSALELEQALDQFLKTHVGLVKSGDIAAYLGSIFSEVDRAPLAPPARQTGSHHSAILDGRGPFGEIEPPEHARRTPEPPIVPAASDPLPRLRAPPDAPARPWALFVLTFLVTATATALVLWLAGRL